VISAQCTGKYIMYTAVWPYAICYCFVCWVLSGWLQTFAATKICGETYRDRHT